MWTVTNPQIANAIGYVSVSLVHTRTLNLCEAVFPVA